MKESGRCSINRIACGDPKESEVASESLRLQYAKKGKKRNVNSTEIKARDRQYILGTYARNDLCIEKGAGASCYSPEGKKYIDFSSGIGVNSLGYSDEGWVNAVMQQLKTCSIRQTCSIPDHAENWRKSS